MSDYVNSIKSLDENSTDVETSVEISTDVAAVNAHKVAIIDDVTPISTSVSDSNDSFEQSEMEVPDYLAMSKIKVRKYQLKK